jgi:hypothetical protein
VHILVGLVAVLALLYFWLIGHWFARVLMFLVLGAVGGFVAAMLVSSTPQPNPIGYLLGFALAWPVSGLPEYYWRRRARLFTGVAKRESSVARMFREGVLGS